MKIEAGKRYRRRDGKVTGYMILLSNRGLLWDFLDDVYYTCDGEATGVRDEYFDIVAEYCDHNKPIRTKKEKEPCTYIGSTSDGRIIVEFIQRYDKDIGPAIAVLKDYELENVPETARATRHVWVAKKPGSNPFIFLTDYCPDFGSIVAQGQLVYEEGKGLSVEEIK